jgi:hypothetical protein
MPSQVGDYSQPMSMTRRASSWVSSNPWRFAFLIAIVVLVVWLIVVSGILGGEKSGVANVYQPGGSTNSMGMKLSGGSMSHSAPNHLDQQSPPAGCDALPKPISDSDLIAALEGN